MLFDLARKFYVFGLLLWPQDLIYLAAMLIICAVALLLSSALAEYFPATRTHLLGQSDNSHGGNGRFP